MNCQYCNSFCIKHGKQYDGKQRYYCKTCKKHQQENYSYSACTRVKKIMLSDKLEQEYGIRTIARTLHIASGTVVSMNRKRKTLQNAGEKPIIRESTMTFVLAQEG